MKGLLVLMLVCFCLRACADPPVGVSLAVPPSVLGAGATAQVWVLLPNPSRDSTLELQATAVYAVNGVVVTTVSNRVTFQLDPTLPERGREDAPLHWVSGSARWDGAPVTPSDHMVVGIAGGSAWRWGGASSAEGGGSLMVQFLVAFFLGFVIGCVFAWFLVGASDGTIE